MTNIHPEVGPAEARPGPLALLYAVIFVEIGIALPFMPVWLSAQALDAGLIGALLALPIAVRIVATAPLMGLIDRGLPARTLLAAGSLVLAVTYGLMPGGAALGWPVLAALIALNAVAAAPLVSSIDYLTLAAVRRDPRLDYARIRLAGSAGFLAANLAGGLMLSALGEKLAVPLLLTALALLASAVAARSRLPEAVAAAPARPGARPRLPVRLRLVIGAAAAIQAGHAAVHGFGSIAWIEGGVAPAWVGALWASGVAAEMVLFTVVGRLPARWRSPFRLLALGGAAAVLRGVGLALAGSSVPALIPLQCLHALTFGATQLGAMAAVSAFAPEGARGRAQGTLAAANAAAAAATTLVAGLAYREAGGPAALALMAPLGLAGLGLTMLAARGARPF